MAYLDDLYRQVQQKQTEMVCYTNAISDCNQKRSQAITRKNQVETINKCLRNDFDSIIESVNGKVKKVINNIEDAFKGDNTIASNLTLDVNANKELSDVSDSDMVNATSQMDAEYNALTQFISQMDAEIASYQARYNECNITIGSLSVQISNEQSRIKEAEEAVRRAESEKNKQQTKVSYSDTTTKKKVSQTSKITKKKKG